MEKAKRATKSFYKEEKKESVYRRVAKFMFLIGTAEAAKILHTLSHEQMEKVVAELMTIRSVSREEKEAVLSEFASLREKAMSGRESAEEILQKLYGEEKAEAILEKVAPLGGEKPFDYLNGASPARILKLFSGESDEVKALALSYIEAKKAAAVINLMRDDEKKLVMKVLAKMKEVSPLLIKKTNEAMHEKSLRLPESAAEVIDGRGVLAAILKRMPLSSEEAILSFIEKRNYSLGRVMRDKMFDFEDVVRADPRYLEEILREYSDIDIAYLVAGKDEKVKEKIYACISSGRQKSVENEAEVAAPLLKKDVERVSESFIRQLRNDYERGKFTVKNRDEILET